MACLGGQTAGYCKTSRPMCAMPALAEVSGTEHSTIDRTERLFVQHSLEALGKKRTVYEAQRKWMGCA